MGSAPEPVHGTLTVRRRQIWRANHAEHTSLRLVAGGLERTGDRCERQRRANGGDADRNHPTRSNCVVGPFDTDAFYSSGQCASDSDSLVADDGHRNWLAADQLEGSHDSKADAAASNGRPASAHRDGRHRHSIERGVADLLEDSPTVRASSGRATAHGSTAALALALSAMSQGRVIPVVITAVAMTVSPPQLVRASQQATGLTMADAASGGVSRSRTSVRPLLPAPLCESTMAESGSGSFREMATK